MHPIHCFKLARQLLLVSSGWALSACSDDPNGCVPNQQLDCTTSNGARGFQVCGADGTYGSCTGVGTATVQPPMGAGGASPGGTATTAPSGASGSGVMPVAGNPPTNTAPGNDPQVTAVQPNSPLPAGDAQAEAFLANNALGWLTEDATFTNGFAMLLCDSGVVSFVHHRDTDIGPDTLSEDFSFLGFWTASTSSSTLIVARAQFLTSTDDERPAPFRQDFAIGLTMPVTVDGTATTEVSEASADCATVMTGLTQQCAQSTNAFCTELRARLTGAAPAPTPTPAPAPAPGSGTSQCPALPSTPNACSVCGAASCCDELTVCTPGTPCDALLTCLTLCPDADDACIQSSCDPIAAQGSDAAFALGTCLTDFCGAECN